MIAIALFFSATVLYLLANYRREATVPQDGSPSANRATSLLMLQAVCAGMGAVAVAVVHMVTFVS